MIEKSSTRNRSSIERLELRLRKAVRMREFGEEKLSYRASTEFAYTKKQVSVPKQTVVRRIDVHLAPTMLTAA